jgi:pimeloyl-ACP methyl ester carboxylesterase
MPLVFVPAWMSQESIWSLPRGRAFLTALARERRLITYDRRGMGASEHQVPSLELDDEVADLQAIALHLSLERFDIFAMAGGLGIKFASTFPDRVRSLVLFAPSPRQRPYLEEVRQRILHSWQPFTLHAADVICPSGPPELREWCSDAIRGSVTPEYVVRLRAQSYDLDEACANIRTPTLIVHGKGIQDTRIESGRETAALIPGARFLAYPGDGQHPLIDYTTYLPAVHDFLSVEHTA